MSLFQDQLGFKPFAQNGCVGPPSTPLPEDAPEDLWMNGALPDQPVEVTRKLFPHQLKSVADMERFERKEKVTLHENTPNPTVWHSLPLGLSTSNLHDKIPDHKNQRFLKRQFGIQADPVGYGKTLSVVALIARDKMEWDVKVPMKITTIDRQGMFEWGFTNYKKKMNTTLIVASLSCVDQWVKDFEFAPSVKVLVVKAQKTIAKMLNPVTNEYEFDYDVVICTPTFYRKVVKANCKTAWKRFVFDEPAHLKVPNMEFPLCGFAWFITATPYSVKKCQSNNWVSKLFYEICGTYRPYWDNRNDGLMLFTLRNPTPFIEKSFEMPPPIVRDYTCFQPLARGLRGIVSAEVHAQIEAGDITGAMAAMGGSSSSKDTIIDVIRTKKNRRRDEIIFHLDRSFGNVNYEKKWQGRLDEIDDQLSQLEETLEEDLQGSCMICLDDLHEPVMEPECGKMFCGGCMIKWVAAQGVSQRVNCPNCRKGFDIASLVHFGTENVDVPARKGPPTKMECMENIFKKRLAENSNAKFILASQFSGGYFESIQACLKRLGLKFCELKGPSSTRTKMIKSFQEGDTQVVFLNNPDNTAGVNLQAATDVIMFNSMDESMRTQVIGRANRVGRTTSVVVHMLKSS